MCLTCVLITVVVKLRAGSMNCRSGPMLVRFLAGWHKEPVNQAIALFALVCAYVSFLHGCAGFYVLAPVKRLPGSIVSEIIILIIIIIDYDLYSAIRS